MNPVPRVLAFAGSARADSYNKKLVNVAAQGARAAGAGALTAYEGKVAAMMSASPGRLGGLRGLSHLRSILSNIGVLVIPDQMAVGEAHTAFAADGDLIDEKLRESVRSLGQDVVRLLNWNRCPEPFPSQLASAACRPFETAR